MPCFLYYALALKITARQELPMRVFKFSVHLSDVAVCRAARRPLLAAGPPYRVSASQRQLPGIQSALVEEQDPGLVVIGIELADVLSPGSRMPNSVDRRMLLPTTVKAPLSLPSVALSDVHFMLPSRPGGVDRVGADELDRRAPSTFRLPASSQPCAVGDLGAALGFERLPPRARSAFHDPHAGLEQERVLHAGFRSLWIQSGSLWRDALLRYVARHPRVIATC